MSLPCLHQNSNINTVSPYLSLNKGVSYISTERQRGGESEFLFKNCDEERQSSQSGQQQRNGDPGGRRYERQPPSVAVFGFFIQIPRLYYCIAMNIRAEGQRQGWLVLCTAATLERCARGVLVNIFKVIRGCSDLNNQFIFHTVSQAFFHQAVFGDDSFIRIVPSMC